MSAEKIICRVCCHHCLLQEGQTGMCGARINRGGRITAANYGKLTSLALDPIEKKPFARFMPGSRILSVGSYGCSLRCPFCQNYEIASARPVGKGSPAFPAGLAESGRAVSLTGQTEPSTGSSAGLPGQPSMNPPNPSAEAPGGGSPERMENRPVAFLEGGQLHVLETAEYTPAELCEIALQLRGRGNIGIAFTYNEPLIGWEFVRDTARLFHQNGMKAVLVTNGMASLEVLREILPFIDAMNIDLKGFSEEFYRDFVGGDLKMVMDFISAAAEGCHVEITKLIIPGKNDDEGEMRRMAAWIASLRGGRGRDIPLHVSRYFPRYKWTAPATRVRTVYRLAEAARESLDFVYTGNC